MKRSKLRQSYESLEICLNLSSCSINFCNVRSKIIFKPSYVSDRVSTVLNHWKRASQNLQPIGDFQNSKKNSINSQKSLIKLYKQLEYSKIDA